jgi:hypothetical protein
VPRPSTEELVAAWADGAALRRLLRTAPDLPPALADVSALLQQLTATSSCAAETLVRLRGAQAAFFAHGFLLSMQLVSGAQVGPADLRPRLDQAAADRLRELCTPSLAAAMTLTLVTEMSPAQLCELDLGDVAADAAAVRVDGEWFTIPAYAHSLVRAHLLDRASVGAGPADPLFVARRSQQRLGQMAMVGWLGTVSRRTAVARPPAAEYEEWWWGPAPTDQWLRRRGLAVTWIGYPYTWPATTRADAH